MREGKRFWVWKGAKLASGITLTTLIPTSSSTPYKTVNSQPSTGDRELETSESTESPKQQTLADVEEAEHRQVAYVVERIEDLPTRPCRLNGDLFA
jgi:hypothetical protein